MRRGGGAGGWKQSRQVETVPGGKDRFCVYCKHLIGEQTGFKQYTCPNELCGKNLPLRHGMELKKHSWGRCMKCDRDDFNYCQLCSMETEDGGKRRRVLESAEREAFFLDKAKAVRTGRSLMEVGTARFGFGSGSRHGMSSGGNPEAGLSGIAWGAEVGGFHSGGKAGKGDWNCGGIGGNERDGLESGGNGGMYGFGKEIEGMGGFYGGMSVGLDNWGLDSSGVKVGGLRDGLSSGSVGGRVLEVEKLCGKHGGGGRGRKALEGIGMGTVVGLMGRDGIRNAGDGMQEAEVPGESKEDEVGTVSGKFKKMRVDESCENGLMCDVSENEDDLLKDDENTKDEK